MVFWLFGWWEWESWHLDFRGTVGHDVSLTSCFNKFIDNAVSSSAAHTYTHSVHPHKCLCTWKKCKMSYFWWYVVLLMNNIVTIIFVQTIFTKWTLWNRFKILSSTTKQKSKKSNRIIIMQNINWLNSIILLCICVVKTSAHLTLLLLVL